MRGKTALALLAAFVAATLPQAQAASDAQWKVCSGGDKDAAIAACTRILAGKETKRNRAIAFHWRGLAYHDKGDRDRAIVDYSQALALNPKDSVGFVNRGNTYSEKHDYDRAIADYGKALALDPKLAAALGGRASAYYAKGDNASARRDAERALKIDPKQVTATYLLKWLDAAERQASEKASSKHQTAEKSASGQTEAKGVFVEALRLTLSPLTSGLRLAYRHASPANGALVLKVEPESAAEKRGFKEGDLIVEVGGTPVSEPRDVARLVAEQQSAGRAAVLVLLRTPRLGQRFVTLAINPQAPPRTQAASVEEWNACRGSTILLDAKIAACTRIVEGGESPHDKAIALNLRGVAYFYQHEYERAIADLTQAIALDPNHAVSFTDRANAYFELGDRALARRDAERALEIAPNQTRAKTLLTWLDAAERPAAETKPEPPTVEQQVTKAEPADEPVVTRPLGKRVALVIGNAAYRHTSSLVNPRNDAADTAEALKGLGFTVLHENDLDKAGMDRAFARFAREAQGAEAALFYYAGHAMQFEGVNYLMPVDAALKDAAGLPFEMTRLDDVLAGMRGIEGVRLAVLDSCRNNPLEEELKRSASLTRGGETTRGLARVPRPEGLLIAYATQPGQVADDGKARNSPFTAAFLDNLATPGLEVGLLFRRITGEVRRATAGRQVPELSISLEGEFYFRSAP